MDLGSNLEPTVRNNFNSGVRRLIICLLLVNFHALELVSCILGKL